MAKKILITGAGGFVGINSVPYFLNLGYSVRALVRRNQDFLDHENLEVVTGNMNDYEFLSSVVRDVDIIIHLAAAKSDESDSYETNVRGAENLERAAFENGVSRIIVLSTLSTKISKKGIYAETKSRADTIFLGGRVPVTILLSSVIYGDTSSGVFGSMVRFSRLPIVPVIGAGVFGFAPIHVLDVIRAMDIALSSPNMVGKVYDIGGPDRLSFNDCIRKVGRIINGRSRIFIIHIPIILGYSMAYAARFFFKKPPITVSNILGSSQEVVIDTEPFFKDFNFIPMGFEEGLDRVVNDEKKNIAKKEARIILKYIFAGIRIESSPDVKDIADYLTALNTYGLKPFDLNHPIFKYSWLLGPVDAISRIRYKNSNLQRKLLISAAFAECMTESATALLLRKRSAYSSVAVNIIVIAIAMVKLAAGLILPIKFIKKYVQ